jgi:methionyl-tRNA synthetase
MSKQYHLIAPALTYANGPIHLGHLVGTVQADVYARALRMAGKDVLFVCGSDSHGTPIEINAKKAGIPPAQFTAQWQAEHAKDFAAFGIVFDGHYGSTHTPENERHSVRIFEALKAGNHIEIRDVEQLYDPTEKRFLPDRMVKGTCPKCGANDQYGDACERCGSTYQPQDLIDPRSAITGAKPILKSSKHYFFVLKHFTEQLRNWIKQPNVVPDEMRKYVARWIDEGLKDWDISRDGPYFGFKIPGEDNKYFYVWLDAPIGYISLTEQNAKLIGRTWEDYWKNPSAKITHFIGKDIVYFHTLFWPALLMASDQTLPAQIAVNGMLTVNGEKMSKSRGTFLLARDFANVVEPEALRYYLASKSSPRPEDLDLNFADMTARVNADLVNNIVNLLSRSVPLLHRYFGGIPAAASTLDSSLVGMISERALAVEALYLEREFARVAREVTEIASLANKYMQDRAPWEMAQKDAAHAHSVLTLAAWAGKVALGLLKPMLPKVGQACEHLLNLKAPMTFKSVCDPLSTNEPLQAYERLFTRLDQGAMNQLLGNIKEEAKTTVQNQNAHISIEDFAKVELRAAKVIEATSVEGADKLIALKLDVGTFGERRVFTGLKPHVQPEQLLGRIVALVYNLAPRAMKFGTSEGMILACGDDIPKPIFLDGCKPGDRIR